MFFTGVCLSIGGEGEVVSQHDCRWYPSMPCSRSLGGWYPSMPYSFPGPHPRGKFRGIWLDGGLQAYTQAGSWGDLVQAHSQGGSWGGSSQGGDCSGGSAIGGSALGGGACSRGLPAPGGGVLVEWKIQILDSVRFIKYIDVLKSIHTMHFLNNVRQMQIMSSIPILCIWHNIP